MALAREYEKEIQLLESRSKKLGISLTWLKVLSVVFVTLATQTPLPTTRNCTAYQNRCAIYR